jgi:hypothetical protein
MGIRVGMSEHERQADRVEAELDDMQKQGERVEREIEETRKDWEHKKHDSSVPGAAGAPERADGPEPEQQYPAKGD